MWSILRKLYSRLVSTHTDNYYVVARPLTPPPPSDPPFPQGVRPVFIDSLDSPHMTHLVEFSRQLGIDPEFCRKEIQAGEVMSLVIADAGPGRAPAVAATAWTTSRSHWMDVLFHEFDPGPKGCQFINAHVVPEFRGMKLQRLMHFPRFRYAYEHGKRVVFAIIRTTNGPSLHNTKMAGFVRVVRVNVVWGAGFILTYFRRLTHRAPAGRFPSEGWLGSGSLQLARRSRVQRA